MPITIMKESLLFNEVGYQTAKTLKTVKKRQVIAKAKRKFFKYCSFKHISNRLDTGFIK